MDLTKFEAMARNPGRTQPELETMRANALSKGQTEYARIANEVLSERFPSNGRKAGGHTPTVAVFRGKSQAFTTGKEAYLWLVEQFRLYKPALFYEYESLYGRRPTAGRRIARSPIDLFPPGSTRADDPSYYARLSDGWYADTNLNHQGKFTTLCELGYLAKLDYPRDWSFSVEGGTKELAEQQEAVRRVEEFLNELRDD